MTWKAFPEIRLTPKEHSQLEELISKEECPARVKTRARILLMKADLGDRDHAKAQRRKGENQAIAEVLQISSGTVYFVCKQFLRGGLVRALNETRSGKKASLKVRLSTKERIQLEELTIRSDSPARVKIRASILLMADEQSDNLPIVTKSRTDVNQAIAEALQISLRTVYWVRKRFLIGGLQAALYENKRGPKPPEIRLSIEERRQLEELSRKNDNSARVKTRARILLMAAQLNNCDVSVPQGEKNVNRAIAESLQTTESIVRRLRKRFLSGDLQAALYDTKPKRRAPAKTDDNSKAKLIMLARSAPPPGHKRWSLRLLARWMIELGYVDHISYTWVMEILKKTHCDYRSPNVGS